MICQLCLARVATHRVTERSPDDRFAEAQYCQECYAAKYQNPPPPARLLRPKFTIKSIMILVGVWAIPNAVAAWIMRSSIVTGTPAQIRLWTLQAFVSVNLVFGFFVVWSSLLTWVQRLIWHKQTGGLVPMTVQKTNPKQSARFFVRALLPFIALQLSGIFLAKWLASKVGVFQQFQWFALISVAPVISVAALAWMASRAVRDRTRLAWQASPIRQVWRTASPMERALRTIAIAWMLGFMIAIFVGGPNLFRWGFTLWFPIPPLMLILIVVQLLLLAAVATATRRR